MSKKKFKKLENLAIDATRFLSSTMLLLSRAAFGNSARSHPKRHNCHNPNYE